MMSWYVSSSGGGGGVNSLTKLSVQLKVMAYHFLRVLDNCVWDGFSNIVDS